LLSTWFPAYANNYLNCSISSFSTTVTKLQHHLHNLQTKAQLFRSCTQTYISNRLVADVYHNIGKHNFPAFHDQTSPFVSQLHTKYKYFYQPLTNS
jgi:hypothetical protein